LLATQGTGILFRDSLNAITVGTPDVNHKAGSVGIATDPTYNSGRIVPNLVAAGWDPGDSTVRTSWAAPMVSAAAALLLENSQNNPGLSLGTVDHTRGSLNRTIQNAETSEVVKATLMAGADRYVVQRGPDITDYTASSANNLDPRFGAGQMNVHTSYNIQAAGEQNSAQDGGVDVGPLGWDYDPAFGGLNASNATASYFFDLDQPLVRLTATLAWNLDMVGDPGQGPFDATLAATLYDLDLLLIDVDSGTTVADSLSTDENTENLYLAGDDLTAGRRYELRVVPGANQLDFDHDYGIAWRVEVIPEPASIVVGVVGLTLVTTRRRRRN
jgi:hypothetical protein